MQFCGLTEKEIPAIAERNPEKYGCFTPGTLIPIITETEARERRPDYLLVLPWHFRGEILRRDAGRVRHSNHFGYGLELKTPPFWADIAARVIRQAAP